MSQNLRGLLPRIACLAACAALPMNAAVGFDASRTDVRQFISELSTTHDFEAGYIASILAGLRSQQVILDAISRPAERVRPWHEYRQIFLTQPRISGGAAFIEEHAARLERTAARTGVPPEMIAAIIGVETFYGARTGTHRVVEALATLAFDYPPRSSFFRSELMHLFLLAREEGLELTELRGSYAGAMGAPQFIASSYRAYAVDGSGNGRRDLFNDWDDIVASVANYFVAHRWRSGEPVAAPARLTNPAARPEGPNQLRLDDTVGGLRARGVEFSTNLPDDAPAQLHRLDGIDGDEYWVGFHNFYVITRYNRSVMYALAVHQLAEAIAEEAGKTRAQVAGTGAP
ncbi:MAG: lytic murein transglycosylase B [Chromatiales bacterium]|nr:lytic murein transglycosylase B [Chromatiales bacterium]